MDPTVVFLLGLVVGACAAWALLLLYWLLMDGRLPDSDVEDSRRPGYVHPPSTEAMAAQTDRRTR